MRDLREARDSSSFHLTSSSPRPSACACADMVYDVEKQHGEPEILPSTPPPRPLRPLNAEEKLAATAIDANSCATSSEQGFHGVETTTATTDKDNNDLLSKLSHLEATLDRKLGVESQAIERKLPHDRQLPTWQSQLNMALLWASGTMNISCFATGFLGWEFGLSLTQSVVICVFASLLGGAASGFCATMGAATGLRQISIGRFSFGWWPNKIVAALNVVQQLGWSAVGCITGGLVSSLSVECGLVWAHCSSSGTTSCLGRIGIHRSRNRHHCARVARLQFRGLASHPRLREIRLAGLFHHLHDHLWDGRTLCG